MPTDTTRRPNRAEYTPQLQADINLLWARLNNMLGPHQTTILFKGRGKAEFIADMLLIEHVCPMDWAYLGQLTEAVLVLAVRTAMTLIDRDKDEVDLKRLMLGSKAFTAAKSK
jgi:hypothetical protein